MWIEKKYTAIKWSMEIKKKKSESEKERGAGLKCGKMVTESNKSW